MSLIKKAGNEDPEVETFSKIVLQLEDLSYISNFFNFFSVKMPDALVLAVDNFKLDPSLKNQRAVRISLCEFIEHDKILFNDSALDLFKKRAAEISCREAFEQELLPLLKEK